MARGGGKKMLAGYSLFNCIRISRLKFWKIQEYFRNKPQAEILKWMLFSVLKISIKTQYNLLYLFN